jgi:hypothetical protein
MTELLVLGLGIFCVGLFCVLENRKGPWLYGAFAVLAVLVFLSLVQGARVVLALFASGRGY